MRQIPQSLPVWSSSLWISKVGDVFRRYFNISTKLWHFDDTPVELIESSGRVGLKVDNRFVTQDLLIALAWRRMAPHSNERAHSIADDAALDARYLRFEEEEAAEDQQCCNHACIARVSTVSRANSESKINCQCEWLVNWHDNE